MNAKLNENGKFDLFLCRDMGSNMLKVSECGTIEELKKEGRKLLRQGANCGNNFPAREYAYIASDGNMVFGWLNPEEEALIEKWIVISLGAAYDNETKVTSRKNFEQMNLCNVYGNYGQIVGCNDASCYVFSNRYCDIAEHFYNEFVENFPHRDDDQESIWCLVCENFEISYNDFADYLENNESFFCEKFSVTLEQHAEMRKFFLNWKKNNESHTQCVAWNYWDGSNHKGIILKSDLFDTECYELEEDEQIEILKQMPETAPHMEGATAIWANEEFIYYFTRWANDPWFCSVEKVIN